MSDKDSLHNAVMTIKHDKDYLNGKLRFWMTGSAYLMTPNDDLIRLPELPPNFQSLIAQTTYEKVIAYKECEPLIEDGVCPTIFALTKQKGVGDPVKDYQLWYITNGQWKLYRSCSDDIEFRMFCAFFGINLK